MMAAEKPAWFLRAVALLDRYYVLVGRFAPMPSRYARKRPDLGSALCSLLAVKGAAARSANFSAKVGSA